MSILLPHSSHNLQHVHRENGNKVHNVMGTGDELSFVATRGEAKACLQGEPTQTEIFNLKGGGLFDLHEKNFVRKSSL